MYGGLHSCPILPNIAVANGFLLVSKLVISGASVYTNVHLPESVDFVDVVDDESAALS